MNKTRRNVIVIAMILLGAASAGWTQAACPRKPIKLVLGFTPGSAADVVARTVAPKLSETLGEQFIVANKPSAGFVRQG